MDRANVSACIVYVTCPDRMTADVLAHGAVEARFAACANLLPGMHSVYRWQGAVESADEIVLLFKTTDQRRSELMAWIKARHPYQTPCIVVVPLVDADADYVAWIVAETTEPSDMRQ